MDGISTAASVAGLITLSAKLLALCQTYYSAVKHARDDIRRLRDEITSLSDVLANVLDMADAPTSAKLPALHLLTRPDGILARWQAELDELRQKLDQSHGKADPSNARRFVLKDLKWPWSKKDVDKTISNIRSQKDLLNLALSVDNATLSIAIKQGITQLRHDFASARVDERRERIIGWLSCTDPSMNHHAARKKHEPSTGDWLIKNERFKKWKNTSGSTLWLYGIPGAGKTVLMSTVIEELKEHCKNTRAGLAYFYFDFSDLEKQKVNNMLCSLLGQSCTDLDNIPDILKDLYVKCKKGQEKPSDQQVVEALSKSAGEFDSTYIVIDALDECPRDGREELLTILGALHEEKDSKINLLVASRPEHDIKTSLLSLTGLDDLSIQGSEVDSDIKLYIRTQLTTDLKLKRWPDVVKATIEETLASKSNGMFRWVFCQLDALKKCRRRDDLLKCLKDLPPTLADTYARILGDLNEDDRSIAWRALIWLSCAKKPLSIDELAEAAVVDPHTQPAYDPNSCLLDPVNDILEILGSLATIETPISNDHREDSSEIMTSNEHNEEVLDRANENQHGGLVSGAAKLKLAHFSVKDYIISETEQVERSKILSITEPAAEEFVASSCLEYLLWYAQAAHASTCEAELPNNDKRQTWSSGDAIASLSPLMAYAICEWDSHVVRIPYPRRKLLEGTFLRFFSADSTMQFTEYGKFPLQPGLLFPCEVGLEAVVRHILDAGADTTVTSWDGNTSLHKAAHGGFEDIARLLLDHGANINTQNFWRRTPLHVASVMGHELIVRLLLDRGATVDVPDIDWLTALHLAAIDGRYLVVRMLLEAGAAVDAKTSYRRYTALPWAAELGHEAIVRVLLQFGASVVLKNKEEMTALHCAVHYVHIVKVLLDAGSDINAKDSLGDTALTRAIREDAQDTAKYLLSRGATFDDLIEIWKYLNPGLGYKIFEFIWSHHNNVTAVAELDQRKYLLPLAALIGRQDAVLQLLGYGIDINTADRTGNTALIVASAEGCNSIVRLLLERGAMVDHQTTNGDTALHRAARCNRADTVRLLIEHISGRRRSSQQIRNNAVIRSTSHRR